MTEQAAEKIADAQELKNVSPVLKQPAANGTATTVSPSPPVIKGSEQDTNGNVKSNKAHTENVQRNIVVKKTTNGTSIEQGTKKQKQTPTSCRPSKKKNGKPSQVTRAKPNSAPFTSQAVSGRGQKRKRSIALPTEVPDNKKQRGPQRPGTGSYRAYYKRRVGVGETEKDDRIPLIQRIVERTSNPMILDVGCNDGTLTLEVGRLCPSQVIGLDLDKELVRRARQALRDEVFAAKDANKHNVAEDNTQPDGNDDVAIVKEKSSDAQVDACNQFPYNVTFRCEDFAKGDGRSVSEKRKYDVVLCLSVTKWVHIAHGDDGLIRLFAAMRDCLKDDGCLILEPQLKRSYKIARQRGLAPKEFDLGKCKLKPDQFQRYLLTEGGFARMETLRDVRKGHSFNRPVLAFYKSDKQGTSIATATNKTSEASSS